MLSFKPIVKHLQVSSNTFLYVTFLQSSGCFIYPMIRLARLGRSVFQLYGLVRSCILMVTSDSGNLFITAPGYFFYYYENVSELVCSVTMLFEYIENVHKMKGHVSV